MDGLPDLRTFELKVKISALWILLGFTLTLVFTLEELDPGTNGLAQRLFALPSEQLSLLLLGDAIIRLAPFVFAFLSLTLNYPWNRKMNLVLGLIFTVFAFYGMAGLLFTQTSISTAYSILAQLAAMAAPFLIFRYAYRWPMVRSVTP